MRQRSLVLRLAAAGIAALGCVSVTTAPAAATPEIGPHHRLDVFPTLARNLVSFYDFEHPVPGNPAQEQDQGLSGTNINLINGGADMRVPDGAYPLSRESMQAKQVSPGVSSRDDWKAGLYSVAGVPSLHAFNAAREMTIMGWVRMTGQNPSPNGPTSFYGAIGLAGVLSGDSDGHAVRALLELINVDGVLHVVALGRRIDGASSQTFAASEDWHTLLPQNEWVFLAATFNFDTGEMALFKNGRPVDGFYVLPGDPWQLKDTPGPHLTSPTDPRGIKIAGSFPQNTREANPCNCRFDSLMFLDRAAQRWEVFGQYVLAALHFPH
jgi:hypothetical protein